jgi:hypothetical protein
LLNFGGARITNEDSCGYREETQQMGSPRDLLANSDGNLYHDIEH